MLKRGNIKVYFILIVLLLASAGEALAQSRGGVKGVLKDAQSGEPLMYANVALVGTISGTVTELKVPNTLTGEWEVITFDFSANIGETLTRLVFFPDFPDARTAGSVSYVDNIKMILSPVGVEKQDVEFLSVYPNPSTGVLNVQAKGITGITIMDVLGKAIKSVQYQELDYATLSVDDLSDGIYFITVESVSGSKTTKFLKK